MPSGAGPCVKHRSICRKTEATASSRQRREAFGACGVLQIALRSSALLTLKRLGLIGAIVARRKVAWMRRPGQGRGGLRWFGHTTARRRGGARLRSGRRGGSEAWHEGIEIPADRSVGVLAHRPEAFRMWRSCNAERHRHRAGVAVGLPATAGSGGPPLHPWQRWSGAHRARA